MRILFDRNFNTEENYNRSYEGANFQFDYCQPERASLLLSKLKKGDKFIDMACGLAPHCLMAFNITELVSASDFSKKLIESRREAYPEIEFLYDDIRNTRFIKEEFDYIVLGETLEHLECPDQVLKDVVKALKPGGILAVSVPDNDNGDFAKDYHIWTFKEDELKEMMEKYGKVETQILDECNHKFIIAFLTK